MEYEIVRMEAAHVPQIAALEPPFEQRSAFLPGTVVGDIVEIRPEGQAGRVAETVPIDVLAGRGVAVKRIVFHCVSPLHQMLPAHPQPDDGVVIQHSDSLRFPLLFFSVPLPFR